MHSKLKFMVRNRSRSRTGTGKGKEKRNCTSFIYALCGLLFLLGSRVDMQFAFETEKEKEEEEASGRRLRA